MRVDLLRREGRDGSSEIRGRWVGYVGQKGSLDMRRRIPGRR